MAKRKVIWTRTAELQYVGILEYWVNRNKSNIFSKKLVKLVSDCTNQIASTPFIYKSTDYKTTLGNFSVYYKVYDKKIIITAFWDNRQDPKKLLKILKNKK